MSHSVDYYFAPQSPWAYLGHQRFQNSLKKSSASVRVMPIDLGGKVFPISGGLPLGQRAPQRQAYRLTELARFSKWLGAPLHLKPTFFPVSGDDAAKLIIAVDMAVGADAAMNIRALSCLRFGLSSATSPTKKPWLSCSMSSTCLRPA